MSNVRRKTADVRWKYYTRLYEFSHLTSHISRFTNYPGN